MNGVPEHPEALLRERAWLAALARQLVQRGEVADEVAQDAWTAAVLQPAPHTAGVRSWLAAILRKQLAGRRRQEQRRQARERQAARPEAQPPVSETVASFEVQRDVANAVLALAEPYRTVVLLRFWDGLSSRAIAARLGVPLETVRTREKRGLAMLRERLDRVHGGDRRAWLVPLWFSGMRTGSVAASLWMGVALMTAMQKLVVGGVGAAAALLLWLAVPWTGVRYAAPGSEPPGPAPVAAAVAAKDAGASAGNGGEDAAAVDRVAAPAIAAAAWLQVKGRLVDDETGAPVQGLTVTLVCWPSTDEPDVEAVSGTDGGFLLADARAPGHRARVVLVQSPQFALAHVRANYTWDRDGEQDVDVGVVRLVRGTMYSGQVVDLQGRGVAQARLLLGMESIGYSGHGPQHMLARFATVGMGDQDGRFHLALPIGPDIDHGNLLFAVTPQGIGWCRFEPSKQRREVGDLVVRLRPAGDLDVIVRDPNGTAVGGVLVRALPRFGPIGIQSGGWREPVSSDPVVAARFCGRTDQDGRLRLRDLPIGEPDLLHDAFKDQRRYELSIEAEGYPEQPLHGFELQPGGDTRIDVRLQTARRITVTALVQDDLGAAVADATVTCVTEKDVAARTDALGRATLSVSAVPNLGLSASCAGHRKVYQALEPGADTRALQATFVLARVRPLDGQVVDQFGAGVADMDLGVGQEILGSTDADGRFHIEEFPVGRQRLVVALGPGVDWTRWTGEQAPENVDVDAGPVTIVMQRRIGRVDVRIAIVDAATGAALEPTQSMLTLHEGAGHFCAPKRTENQRGLITAKDTPAGRWRLDVVTATGHRGSLPFTLIDGQPPTQLRLELTATGTITGRLQFGELTPPAKVTLQVRHAKLDPTAYVQFHFPGRWHLDAETQTVTDNQFGDTGTLCMQPLQNPSFRLDSADATEELVFGVHGEGIAGEATVRVGPGETRDVVIDVRRKPEPPR